MQVMTEEVPILSEDDRVVVEALDKGFYRLTARYGFMQEPRAQDVLDCARQDGLDLDMMKTSFFVGRTTLLPCNSKGMALWRKRLFVRMGRNAQRFTDFFQIPANRVVELGLQVEW
jgi:KUP system potassium uptake protein